MAYATTTALNNEIARAKAAEKALSDRLNKIEAAGSPPVIVPVPKVVPFQGTAAELATLCADETIDTIQAAAKVYGQWAFTLRLTRQRPLVIDFGTAVWDGGGLATPAFRFGTDSGLPGTPTAPTTNITLQGGTAQNYAIAQNGLFMTGWVENLVLRGQTARACTGMGGSFSHVVYIQHGGAAGNVSKNITVTDLTASLDKTMNGIQLFASNALPVADGITILRAKLTGLNTGSYAYSSSSGILYDGCVFTDCTKVIETGETPHGIVQNCQSVRSGPFSWSVPTLVNGSGNVVT